MKKKWIFIAVGVVLVGIFAMAAMKQRQGKTTAVEMSRATRENVISHVKAPGKIEPFTLVKMSATLPGKVTQLNVAEGDKVRRGQVLLRLDPAQYQADLMRARSALASAESRRSQAKFNMERAKQNLDRRAALAKRNLVSADELEQFSTANSVAQEEYQASLHAVGEARASLDAAEDNVTKTTFVAPFDGVVSQLNVEKGENVITGTMNNPGTQILSVADTSRMIVRTNVDETDVVDVKVGQMATIKVDAWPDSVYHGQVIEVGSTAKGASDLTGSQQSNFEVKVVFLDHVPGIRPGMTADVDIQTHEHKNALAIPIQSVVVRTQRELDEARDKKKGIKKAAGNASAMENETETQKKAKDKEITGVFVVRKNVAVFVPVRPGISSDLNTEIDGDLQPGDQVVSGPYKELRALKDGDQVKKMDMKKNMDKKN
jgi:HlyD family secretion protein